MKGKKLTAKQEKFVNELVSGKSQREAYKQTYSCEKWKEKTIDEAASRLFKNSKVNARYQELIKKHQDKAIITRGELLRGLRKAFYMCLGVEARKDVIIEIIEDEEIIKEKTKFYTDMKSISSIADRIAKLEGWDKEIKVFDEKENQNKALEEIKSIVTNRFGDKDE